MSIAGTRRKAPEPPTDWEDEYHRLKFKFDELKVDYNEKEKHNRLLQARITKLESDLSHMDRQMGTTKADREEREAIESLYEHIAKLKSANTSLSTKNKALQEQLEKKKRELALSKRPTAKRPPSAPSTRPEVEVVPGRTGKAPEPVAVERGEDDANWFEIAKKFKARLAAAEEQLLKLREENEKLRSSKGGEPVQDIDARWRLQQLQAQYDFLVAKTNAQNDSNKQSDYKLEEYHQKVRELRRTLEELRHEKEISDAKATRVDVLEEVVSELRQANRSLEDKIARLCEAPFISDAFGQHDAKMRYEDLLKEREDLMAKVEHLQEAVRTHFSALTSLKQHAAQLREEKEESDKKCEEMRISLQELQAGSNMLQDQLRLYSGDDGVDLETLERALTMVKRATEPLSKLSFLEDPDGEKLVALPAVKRKLEEYQLLNLKLTEENERLENMLKLQTGISRDLHKEIEALVRSRDKHKAELQQKADDFEEIALKRLDKIHALEAQVRQFVYGLAKNRGGRADKGGFMLLTNAAGDSEDADIDGGDVDNALLNELLEMNGGEVREDQNLMEIWVKGATIRDGVLTPGSSCFVVIDFFDYESQTTSLLSGMKPNWDFAATYQITVDDFLLRYLATDVVTLELNMASQGDFTMLARCTVPLSALLKSRPRLQLINHPMLSVKTGQIVANVTIDFRLALPLSELYRLFLERHPAEKRHIEDISAKRVVDAAANSELARNLDGGLVATTNMNALHSAGTREDESRLYNELEIIIHRAHALPLSADGNPPTPYVHFQLLGHPDKLTNPVQSATDPEFNEKFTFPMVTTDQQLRLLQRSKLQLSVIDMKGEEMEMKNDGLIGELFVALAALTEGSYLNDTFNVKDVDGHKVGELFITLKWKYQLKKERDLGPRALSGIEVEILLSAFSPGELQEGVVDYASFCRFMDPPVQAVHAMDKLRAFCNDMIEREGRSAREVFTLLLGKDEERPPIDEDYFQQRMLRTQVDCLPEDFTKLFRHIDNSQEGRVTLDKVLAVLNLDEIAGIPAVLQGKLRERAKDLNSRGIPAVKLFEQADQWGADGLVTRMEFKNVMKRMGFSLPDEPDPLHSYVGDDPEAMKDLRHPNKRTAADPQHQLVEGDILNDTFGSDDNVLPNADKQGAVAATMKEQREIFEAKRSELQQRSHEALSREQQQQNIEGSAAVSDHPMDLAGRLDPFSDKQQHQVSIANKHSGRSYDLDKSTSDSYATKLQSQYRGYQTRKSIARLSSDRGGEVAGGGTSAVAAAVPEHEAITIQTNTLSGQSNILTVENLLRENKRTLIGENQPLPDLATGFLRVDQKRTGLVNRKQFAHVLQQYPTIQLYGAELRAAMDFFDVTMDGNNIDYNAFLRFFRYREPPMLPAIQKLQSMTLRKTSLSKFREMDPTGQGFVKRVDMMRCLKDLGHGFTAQSVMQTMLQLFESRQDGLVNYLNFFEYVRESELSQSLDILSVQLYQLFTKHGESGDTAMREWFSKIDKVNSGKFSVLQLIQFLTENNIDSTKDAVAALYSELDHDGRGVQYSAFAKWLADFVQNHDKSDAELAMYSTLNLAELQRKAYTFVMAIAKSASGNVEDLMESYLVYDWRRTDSGALAKPLFIRATRRVGFPFTMNELRTLASEFSLSNNGEVITYRKFLEFCTPDNRVAATIIVADQNDQFSAIVTEMQGDERARQHSAGSIIRFLEKALERGIDLLTVFGRYDSISVGRITSSEFCAALSDLGLSSVNTKEATEVADRFRASAGEFILYRRIVTDLLRHADEAAGTADVDPVEIVRAALQISRVEVSRLREVFEHYDRRGRGDVRVEDLASIFDEAKLRIKRFEVDLVAEKYTLGDSSWVGYRPLLKQLELKLLDRKSLTKRRVGAVPDEVSTKMKGLIETLIIRGKDYRAELDRFDDSYSGTILQADLKAVLEERFNAGFTNKEIAVLVQAYRSDQDARRLDYVRLIHHLHPRNFGRVTFDITDGDSSGSEPYQLAEALRQKIRRRCDYTVPGELRRPFRHFTRGEGQRSVSLDDFSQAVRNLGMRLASDQEKAVFDMINTTAGSEAFKYSDFVVFVCDPQHADVIWKLRRAIARSRVSEKEIINCLNEQDSNTSGLITAKQFLRALSSCGVELSEVDAIRLMMRFDSEDNQRFDNDKFFRFLRGKQVDEEELNELNEFDLAVTRRLSHEDAEMRRSSSRRGKPDESIELHAWSSLKRRVEEKLVAGYTGHEVFAIFDRDDKGVLDVAALHKGSQQLGLVLTTAEARSMLRRMTVLAGATAVTNASFFDALGIDFREFASDRNEHVANTSGRRRPRSDRDLDEYGRYKDDDAAAAEDDDALSPRGRNAGSGRTNSVLELILSKIKGQLEVAVNPRDKSEVSEVLRRALDNMGLQRAGKVTPRELSRAFESLGVRVSSKDVLSIYDGLDLDRMGLLPHEDLVEALFGAHFRRNGSSATGRGSGGGDDDYDRYVEMRKSRDGDKRDESDVRSALRRRRDLIEEVTAQIRALRGDLNKHLEVMNVEFRTVDADKIGVISKSYFARALSRVGIKLPLQVEKDLVDTLTEGSSHEIKYGDFLDALREEFQKDDQADDIVQRIKNRLSRESKRGRDVEDAFISIDRNADGHIDVFEFEDAMKKLGIPLSREESKRVLSRFSDNGVTIKHREFLKAFRDCEGSSGGVDGRDDELEEDVASIVNSIRHRIEEHLGPGVHNARRMKETFAEIDRDFSGRIDKTEFKQAMKLLRVDLSTMDTDKLYRKFDRGAKGLDYREFIDMIGFDGKAGSSSSRRGGGSKVDEVIASIRSGINEYLGPGASNAAKVKEIFAEIDRDRSGAIDKVEFKRAMRILHVTVSPSEIDQIFDHYDPNGHSLAYRKFIELLDFSGTRRDRSPDASTSSAAADGVESIVKAVRRSIEDYLGPGARAARKMKETFADMDRDGSGRIDKREFGQAMRVLKVDLNDREVDALFRRYDVNGNGLDYKEFIMLLGIGTGSSSAADTKENSRGSGVIDAIVESVRRSIEEYLGPGARTARKIKEVFADMDRDSSNTIDKSEFEKAMKILKVRLTLTEIDQLFRQYDSNGRGLNYKEFIDLLGFDSSPRSSSSRTGSRGAATATVTAEEVESIVRRVRSSIEDHLGPGARTARKIKEVFADIDRDNSSTIDKLEFEEAMKILKVRLSPRDIDQLFRRYDSDGRGLNYREFIELLGFDTSPRSGGGSSSSAKTGFREVDEVEAAVQTIRRSIEEHLGPGARTARKIKEVFADIDRDSSNSIDKAEFEEAMKILKVRLNPRDIDAIFRRYDRDGRGLNYREFIELLKFDSSAGSARTGVAAADGVESIVKAVRRSIEDYLGPGARAARKMKETFADMDRDGSGRIDKREFGQAMRVLKVDLNDREVDALFRRYDVNGNGLDYKEFIILLGIN